MHMVLDPPLNNNYTILHTYKLKSFFLTAYYLLIKLHNTEHSLQLWNCYNDIANIDVDISQGGIYSPYSTTSLSQNNPPH